MGSTGGWCRLWRALIFISGLGVLPDGRQGKSNFMSLRKQLIRALSCVLVLVVGVVTYFVCTWPSALPTGDRASFKPPVPRGPQGIVVPPYDGKEPFELKINGMPGLKLYLDPTDQVMTPTILVIGNWETIETHWFIRTVKPGDTVVDAGANIGYYTIIASKLVGDKGKVYAFEPDPKNFDLLEKNVRMNGCSGNVVLERKALSNRKGTIKLFISVENKGDHRIYQPEGPTRDSVEVEAVRLDEYFKEYQHGIDVFKTDTQGADGVILEGMKGLLERQSGTPTIFMEFWPKALLGMGTDGGELLKMLQSYRYRFYEYVPKSDNEVRPVEPADVLKVYPADGSGSQTNFMLLRDGRELPKE
jgi:FkbM family methyltransferase